MGIVVQKSCLVVPDTRARRRMRPRLRNATRRKLMRRRKQQFDALIDEARLWSYVPLLPTKVVTNVAIPELATVLQEVKIRFLGVHVSDLKIMRVFGRLARNILIPGMTNLETGDTYYPECPPDDLLRDYLNKRPVTAHILDNIHKECPLFKAQFPDARTWSEVSKQAKGVTVQEEALEDLLEHYQSHFTLCAMGIPYENGHWSARAIRSLQAGLQSTKPEKLDKEGFVEADLIVMVAAAKDVDSQPFEATMNSHNNMTLYPPFFWDDTPQTRDSIKGIRILPGSTSLKDIVKGSRVQLIEHEVMHSKGVIWTEDHHFEYCGAWEEFLDESKLAPMSVFGRDRGFTEDTSNCFIAYGIESCLALARGDFKCRTNKADDNADSWAIYVMLRVLLLIYPDLDFLGAIIEEDLTEFQERTIYARSKLLHHCTLFECLRHPEAGKIADHPDYEPAKDPWAKRKKPTTVTELLKILKTIVGKHRNKQEKSRKKRRIKRRNKSALGSWLRDWEEYLTANNL